MLHFHRKFSSSITSLYCTFLSVGCTAFLSTTFEHLHYFLSSSCLFEIFPCSLFSFTWHPCFPHLSHTKYDTTTSLVYHPNSNRHALSGIPSPQYSCTLCHKTCTRLLFHSPCCASHSLATCAASSSSTLFNLCCYVFCGIAICTTLSTSFLSTFFYSRYSLHLCLSSPHLKHSTLLTFSCLLIVLSSNPHYIILLLNISNLFLGTTSPFSFSPLFL